MKPCPFCESTNITCNYRPESEDHVCWCPHCGAYGPFAVSEAEAREMWNLRRPMDDLMATCEALLATGTEWDGEADGQHWERITIKREVIEQARAALAAARGEAVEEG